MSWETVVTRKLMLRDRAKSSGDFVRAKELLVEINDLRQQHGQKPMPDDTPPPRKKKKVGNPNPIKDVFLPCPCGCGNIPEGFGIFMPGHDGRVCGWIVRVERGKAKLQDLSLEVQRIYKEWVKQGKPGEPHHPKIKKIIKGMRK